MAPTSKSMPQFRKPGKGALWPPEVSLSPHHAGNFRRHVRGWLKQLGHKPIDLVRDVKPYLGDMWVRDALRAKGGRKLMYRTALEILRRLIALARQTKDWHDERCTGSAKDSLLYEIGHFGLIRLAQTYDHTISEDYPDALVLTNWTITRLSAWITLKAVPHVRHELTNLFATSGVKCDPKLRMNYEVEQTEIARETYWPFFECMGFRRSS